MPGVPSGKGCEACRKQKKKCDQAKPACSRCTRLRLTCVGAGQQRYVFKSQTGSRVASDSPASSNESRDSSTRQNSTQLTRLPSNEESQLSCTLIQKVKPAADAKYNLFWSYGSFFNHIPKRIGVSKALDAGVEVLLSAHSDFTINQGQCTPHTLSLYSNALRSVRTSLNNRREAQSAETLCAVYLLLLCQTFIPVDKSSTVTHGEGAASILKARGYYDSGNEFERELLLSLRGPVVFEGFLNDRIDFTPTQWKSIVENQLDTGPRSNDGQVVQFLSQIPHHLERGRQMRRRQTTDPALLQDLTTQYQTILEIMAVQYETLTQFETNPSPMQTYLTQSMPLHFLYQRSYGISLFTALVFNYMLQAASLENHALQPQAAQFARDCLVLANNSHAYRPLGAAYVSLCLMAAWVSAGDQAVKQQISDELDKFQSDFPGEAIRVPSETVSRLERRLRFESVEPRGRARACL